MNGITQSLEFVKRMIIFIMLNQAMNVLLGETVEAEQTETCIPIARKLVVLNHSVSTFV